MLVAIDYITKWWEGYSIPDQDTTSVTVDLAQGMFRHFGTPSVLHSDQGRNFDSRLFAGMCDRLGIRKTQTTPLHPQSDGLVERFMQTLGSELALETAPDQSVWGLEIPFSVIACLSAAQESTVLHC